MMTIFFHAVAYIVTILYTFLLRLCSLFFLKCLLFIFFISYTFSFFFFFFFQAEDGIRDHCVTGVQTCALPIYLFVGGWEALHEAARALVVDDAVLSGQEQQDRHGHVLGHEAQVAVQAHAFDRSEERRVGKECRSRWSREQ